jgi:hypothetical protein
MSMSVVTTVAGALSANHPLGQLLAQTLQPDTSDPVATAFQQGGAAALLIAGQPDLGPGIVNQPAGQGLTAAGVAAVLSSWNTYVAGLSAAKKAQIGCLRCNVTSVGLLLSVHSADVATQAASLVTTLNTGANFGAIGT